MFMQQLPNPAAGVCVAVEECERTITSAPLKTPAVYMTVFAAGDASSSAGVPYAVTVPGVLELVRNSATAIAAAVLAGEPRDELGQGERALQVVHTTNHVGGGGALGGRFLRHGGSRVVQGAQDEGGERECGAHDEPQSSLGFDAGDAEPAAVG